MPWKTIDEERRKEVISILRANMEKQLQKISYLMSQPYPSLHKMEKEKAQGLLEAYKEAIDTLSENVSVSS